MDRQKPIYKRQLKLSRRQFLGLMGISGVGAGLCGGITASGLLALRTRSISSPTDLPVLILSSQPPQIEKPTVVDRSGWGAIPPDHNARNETGYYDKVTNPDGWYVYPDTLKTSYQTLVIHHSGFYWSNAQDTLNEILRLHHQDRGWADVAYHFLIGKDGAIYEGRDLAVRGAHVGGFNTGSVGVCLLGDFTIETPSQAQLDATYMLNAWLASYLQLTHLAGHQQFSNSTVCPGTFIESQLPDMAHRAGLQFGTDGYIPIGQAPESCGCCSCTTAV